MKPCTNVVEGLRGIANSIESGDLEADTIVLATHSGVFQLGTHDDQKAAENAIYLLTLAIHKLMLAEVIINDEMD